MVKPSLVRHGLAPTPQFKDNTGCYVGAVRPASRPTKAPQPAAAVHGQPGALQRPRPNGRIRAFALGLLVGVLASVAWQSIGGVI